MRASECVCVRACVCVCTALLLTLIMLGLSCRLSLCLRSRRSTYAGNGSGQWVRFQETWVYDVSVPMAIPHLLCWPFVVTDGRVPGYAPRSPDGHQTFTLWRSLLVNKRHHWRGYSLVQRGSHSFFPSYSHSPGSLFIALSLSLFLFFPLSGVRCCLQLLHCLIL